MKYKTSQYQKFIYDNKSEISEVFAPNKNESRSHNVRSLKCAISDFFRVYEILIDENIDNIEKWLYSFIAYTISCKANIINVAIINSLYDDDEKIVRDLYPAFKNQYIFKSVKSWIINGIWDNEAIAYEIQLLKQREQATRPCEIIKTYRIIDIDDEVLEEGFKEFLDMLYDGTLTLDDYARFIENCAWARKDNYIFPLTIEWDKVKIGINNRINLVKSELPKEQLIYTNIAKENKEYFSEEEWSSYMLISNFARGDSYMFLINRTLYIEEVCKLKSAAFMSLQNKRYDIFDTEMAEVTAEAFSKEGNSGKNFFIMYFSKMWNSNLKSPDIELSKTIDGLLLLKKLIIDQSNCIKKKKSERTYKLIHTEKYIDAIDDLIKTAKSLNKVDMDIL